MNFKQQVTVKFECKDLGELDRILNMEANRTAEAGSFPFTVLLLLEKTSGCGCVPGVLCGC